MTFFNPTAPILRTKQKALDIQDNLGVWKIELKFGVIPLFSTSYTRIDQVFLLWGILTLVLFSIGQMLSISWVVQAILSSVLTVVATVGMASLTFFWARVESLVWVILVWVVLMLLGIVLTDVSIFFNLGIGLANLCSLWLGLSSIGYGITGVGLRSKTFLWIAAIHLCSIWLLPLVSSWQFLATGLVIGGSLLLLAQFQWDMRPPIEYKVLVKEQKEFNRQQHLLRQN